MLVQRLIRETKRKSDSQWDVRHCIEYWNEYWNGRMSHVVDGLQENPASLNLSYGGTDADAERHVEFQRGAGHPGLRYDFPTWPRDSATQLIRTGLVACLILARIRSAGASLPVNNLNWYAAWRTNISTPVISLAPANFAYLINKVFSGL